MQGWFIMNIIVDLDPNQANTDPYGKFIDIVAWKIIDNTRVVAFLKVDRRQYSGYSSSLYATLSAMINHVRLHGDTLTQYGVGLYMIGVIFTKPQSDQAMQNIADQLAGSLPKLDPNMFVVLVFRSAGTHRYTVYIICPSGGCSSTMIRAGGDAACDFLAARIQSANLSGITHTCADGTEVDIKTINQP